jgi:hypothetical protein
MKAECRIRKTECQRGILSSEFTEEITVRTNTRNSKTKTEGRIHEDF